MPIVAKVSQSPLFQKKLEAIKSKHKRIDDSIQGVVWLLSRSPELGGILGPPLSPKYRILSIDPPINPLPKIWIAYKFEDKKVTLEDVEVLSN